MSVPRPPLPTRIRQPGPVGPPVHQVPTRLIEVEFALPAAVPLDLSLAKALAARNIVSGVFHLCDAPMAALDYVIPDLPQDASHVAWYSTPQNPPMPGAIVDAAITCGPGDAGMTYHCHGKFSDARGAVAMGHLLVETCRPAHPVGVTGFAFRDAAFQRRADAETGFTLFSPVARGPAVKEDAPAKDDGILLRIAPNIEISQTLIDCCRAAGWQRASVHGLGSLIGAHFADENVLDSFATEFYFTRGLIDLTGPTPSAALDVALVGLDGSWMEGRLDQGQNPVLITTEILLCRRP